MSRGKDEVIKNNLRFIYGRNGEHLPDLFPSEKNKNPRAVFDPDKAAILPSNPVITNLLADTDVLSEFDKGEFESLHPCYLVNVYLMGDPNPYPSFEHALQASKFKKVEMKEKIRSMKDIKEVKRFVSKQQKESSFQQSDESQKNDIFFEDWQNYCLTFGECLLRDKVIRNNKVKTALINTKHQKLVFKNDYNDTFWGFNPVKLVGQNHLGKLLEKIRLEVQQGTIYRFWIHDRFRLYPETDNLRLVVYCPRQKTEQYHQYLNQTQLSQQQANPDFQKTALEEEMKFLQENRFADEPPQQVIANNEAKNNDAEGEGEEEEYVLDEKTIVLVGQKNDQYRINDLLLYHYSVSRQHAAFVVDKDGQLFLVDFESRNKTFVNGSPLIPFHFHKLNAEAGSDLEYIQFGALGKLYHPRLFLDSTEVKREEIFTKVIETAKETTALSKEDEQENTVFVRNLAYDCKEEDVRSFFEACGKIAHLSVPIDRKTDQTKGIAFITFQDYTGVLQALIRDGEELKGRYIQVKRSDARKSDVNPSMRSHGSVKPDPERKPAREQSQRDIRVKEEEKRDSGDRRNRDHNKFGIERTPRDRSRADRNNDSNRGFSSRDNTRREETRARDDSRDRRERSRRRDHQDGRRNSRERRGERRRSSSRGRRDSRERYSRGRERSDSSRGDSPKIERKRGFEGNRRSPARKKAKEDRNASPPRRRQGSSPSASPPRRRQGSSPSASPPRRRQGSSPSASPPRRRQGSSPSASPPRSRL